MTRTGGASRQSGGGQARQTIIEPESGFLFVMAAGQGNCLAVLGMADASAGVLAFQVAMLVRRTGRHLTAPARLPGIQPAAG